MCLPLSLNHVERLAVGGERTPAVRRGVSPEGPDGVRVPSVGKEHGIGAWGAQG